MPGQRKGLGVLVTRFILGGLKSESTLSSGRGSSARDWFGANFRTTVTA